MTLLQNIYRAGRRTAALVCAGLLCLLAAGTAGCGKTVDEDELVPAAPEEGIYVVYYRNTSSTELTCLNYRTETEEAEKLAEELMDRIVQGGGAGDYVSVIPSDGEYTGCSLEDDVLYLNFNSFFSHLTATDLVLCEAALTRTLTEIPGVDYISIYADGQPLMTADGNPVGFLAASQYVDVLGRDINSMTHAEFTLYYGNEDGTLLTPETLTATYSSSLSVEQYVVQWLIDGPSEKDHVAVIPADTKILSVTTNDGLCVVNLDSGFLGESESGTLNVSPYLPVYSIVNSLTELSNITSVQIMINGSADVTYGGEISFAEPFSRDLDYIEADAAQ